MALYLLQQAHRLLFGAPVTNDPLCYTSPPTSKADLNYAELAIIDISKANSPEGRVALAAQVVEAMTTQGFFYVINHGYTSEETNKMFAIGNLTFDGVPDEEKKLYMGDPVQTGSYEGYKPLQFWRIDRDIHDQIGNYNIHRDTSKQVHPPALRPYLPDIEAFARHNHFNVLHPILRLLAIGLELSDEDALVKLHQYDAEGATSVSFLKYYSHTEHDESQAKGVWLKGHTDTGGVTILWSQPVGGLQIYSQDRTWKWIRHIDNALVVNIGDALQFLSGGFYKPTIHRVIKPPPDQSHCPRQALIYFTMPDDNVKLVPLAGSPVLERVGIKRRCKDEDAPTMEMWRKGRTASYGRVSLKVAAEEKNVEIEVVSGVVVKHYN